MHRPKPDLFLIAASLVAVALPVIGLAAFPAAAEGFASTLFEFSTRAFGTLVLVFVFAAALAAGYLAFSKYGNIRLGSGKPEYATATWVFMFICAGTVSYTHLTLPTTPYV